MKFEKGKRVKLRDGRLATIVGARNISQDYASDG